MTDVGSVKAEVVRELESIIARAGAHFVGSHPMAGGEKMGVLAARADLFENAVCVVTPTKKSNADAVRKVEQFWKSLGARVLKLDAAQHDLLVSRSSHLPHVVAAALANLVLNPASPKRRPHFARTVFATRRASRPVRRRCGATSRWPTAKICHSRWTRSSRNCKNFKKLSKRRRRGDQKVFCDGQQRRDNWCANRAMNNKPQMNTDETQILSTDAPILA